MKKLSGLLIMFVMALLVTQLFAVTNLDGLVNEVNFSDLCIETKINMATVENQIVTASIFGGVAVLSVNFSEQVVIDNIYILSVVPVNELVLSSFPISLERQISRGWNIYLAVES